MARAVRARRMALAAVGVLALAGCTVPSNAPAGYDDGVREFFLEGCTGDVPETDGTTTTLATSGECECAFGVFESMVPYDDDAREELTESGDLRYEGYPADAPTFSDLDTDPSEGESDWDALPTDVRAALDDCAGSDGGSPGGTQPPGTATDPTTDDTAG